MDQVELENLFHSKVRELACYLYVMRGCQSGRSLDYWLEAERRLQESLGPALNSENRLSKRSTFAQN